MHENMKIYVLNTCLSKIHIYFNYVFFESIQRNSNKEFFL